MKFRWLTRRTKDLVTQSLAHQAFLDFDHPDVNRFLVAGAIVVNDEGHCRIESGAESDEELERIARRYEGTCDCGSVLSNREERYHCRACNREYCQN
ncbi:MAG: hypothetical protein GY725_24975 [bacterium]|nr:hypothetical protein [bacterium]